MTDRETASQTEQRTEAGKRSITPFALLAAWFVGAGALVFATLPTTHVEANHIAHPLSASDGPQGDRMMKAANAQTLSFHTESAAVTQTFDFIVKFTPEHAAMEACRKMFREDKDAAKSMFTDWARQTEHLNDVSLKKVSYSGEMILTWHPDLQRPLTKTDVETKLENIKSMSSVRYADKDSQISFQEGQ